MIRSASLFAAAAALGLAGCAKPSAANIALRKKVQDQTVEIDRLTRQHAADQADTRANQDRAAAGPTSVPATDDLFTTHGIRLTRLTASTKDALTVHLVPTDDTGDDFKAAGGITVDAYDLSADGRRIGHWVFSSAQTRPLWNGTGLRYEYVVPCPWPQPPEAGRATVKVSFQDALTGRRFDVQQEVRIEQE